MNIKLEKKNLFLYGLIAVLLILDIIIIGIRLHSKNISYSKLIFENSSYQTQKLKAVNNNASKSLIKKGYAYYKFNEQQKDILKTLYKESNFSISVKIGVKNFKNNKYNLLMQSEQIFYYGLLYEEDFDKKGNSVISNGSALCGTDLRNFYQNSSKDSMFEVGYALEKNLDESRMPSGIAVYSSSPVVIYDFYVKPVVVGFDFSSSIPFFGLASNGGSFGSKDYRFDFSGASMVFPVENTLYSVMPVYQVSFSPVKDYGSPDNQVMVKSSFSGQRINFRRSKNNNPVEIQSSTLQNPYGFVEFNENSSQVEKCLLVSNDKELLPHAPNKVFKALKTDPGFILNSKIENWRVKNYEVYEWNVFPHILFFDTLDYDVQGRFFTRLAFFAEKTGFKGRILTNEEIGDMHGYNAHDYSAETLARFFTLAMRTPDVLNEEELILLDILLQNGLLKKEGNDFVPVEGAVISISRDSQKWLRHNFIAHEAWHGIFFIDEAFRNAVAAVYYTVDDNTMGFIKGFWASQPSLGYDQDDEFLMKNEFMAYIMQQRLYGDGGVASYFVHCSNRKSDFETIPELSDWVRSTGGQTFEDAGRALNEYAFDRWGLACGRVSLIDVY